MYSILLALLIPFVGTAIGSAFVFFMRKEIPELVQKILLGFASGVMVAASVWSLLIPGMEMAEGSVWPVTIGLFAGLLYPPVGMILGSLLGAFAAELLFAKKDTATSLKSAFGAFLGFLSGTGIKLVAAGVMLYYIFVFAF